MRERHKRLSFKWSTRKDGAQILIVTKRVRRQVRRRTDTK